MARRGGISVQFKAIRKGDLVQLDMDAGSRALAEVNFAMDQVIKEAKKSDPGGYPDYPGRVSPSGKPSYRRGSSPGGGLQFHWQKRTQVDSGGITVRVWNTIPYATYVQGDNIQWYHSLHGWRTIYYIRDRVFRRLNTWSLVASYFGRTTTRRTGGGGRTRLFL